MEICPLLPGRASWEGYLQVRSSPPIFFGENQPLNPGERQVSLLCQLAEVQAACLFPTSTPPTLPSFSFLLMVYKHPYLSSLSLFLHEWGGEGSVVGHLSWIFEGRWLAVSKIWQLTSISLNLDYGVLSWDLAASLGKKKDSLGTLFPSQNGRQTLDITKFFRKLKLKDPLQGENLIWATDSNNKLPFFACLLHTRYIMHSTLYAYTR